jgi:hypothetical protein
LSSRVRGGWEPLTVRFGGTGTGAEVVSEATAKWDFDLTEFVAVVVPEAVRRMFALRDATASGLTCSSGQ